MTRTAPDTPLISGGPIRHRQPAWALMPRCGERAHYWIPDPEAKAQRILRLNRICGPYDDGLHHWRSACGICTATHGQFVVTQEGVMDRLEPGNWPRCKTCRRIRKRWEPSR